MDFQFSEEQIALRDLAREILEKEVTLEHLKEIEASRDRVSDALWARLAEANLLGLAVPERYGGMGFGILELCVLLQELGRAVAPVPVLPTLLLGGLPITVHGTEVQKQRFLAPLAAGKRILTAGLVDAESGDPGAPATTARREGPAWILDGCRRFVPAAHRADRILVPARVGDEVGIFLIDPTSGGVTRTRQVTTNEEPVFEVRLRGVVVGDEDVLGGTPQDGASIARWLYDCALVGLCALQLGVSERALEITTHYAKERVQFGAPIGSFPAVQHRAADAYIDLEAMRWTTLRAAWRLSESLPASREAAVAKFWAAEGGSRIANTAQHLHGGIGVDVDYPIHRYTLWSKFLELDLGSATPQLVRLGRDMARTGPEELV